MPPIQLSFLKSWLKSLVTSLWKNRLEKSMRMRVSSRENSQWKLHHETHLFLSAIDKNRVCSATGDGLSALTLQQGDNYLSTLSYAMLMMLQMLRMKTTMPQCWKVLSFNNHCKKHKLIPRRYQGLQSLDLKHLIQFIIPHKVASTQCCIHPWLCRFRTNDCQLWYKRYCLPLQCLGEAKDATNLDWSCSFSMMLKSEAHEALSLLFQKIRCHKSTLVITTANPR